MPKIPPKSVDTLRIAQRDSCSSFDITKRKYYKQWVYRYQLGGKRLDFSLGTYPSVSLAEARKRLLKAYGCKTCRYHGARKIETGIKAPNYKHGEFTKENLADSRQKRKELYDLQLLGLKLKMFKSKPRVDLLSRKLNIIKDIIFSV